ncbi:hypothetical protein [Catenulispora yoronensis]|uniref:hypothetical protein n=1 Tax=Catenulispora yoronensis TaxID=450799 RepID=UPI0031DA15F4
MSGYLTQLADLMGRPASTGFPVDWTTVEAQLSLGLPPDYKALVEHFGPGTYDAFVTVNVPGIAAKHYDLVEQVRSFGQEQESENSGFAPHVLQPAAGGLVLWGATVSGDLFFWEPRVPDPAAWPVLAWDVEDGDYFTFEGGTVEFLLRFFDGTLEPDLPMILPREGTAPMLFAPDPNALR